MNNTLSKPQAEKNEILAKFVGWKFELGNGTGEYDTGAWFNEKDELMCTGEEPLDEYFNAYEDENHFRMVLMEIIEDPILWHKYMQNDAWCNSEGYPLTNYFVGAPLTKRCDAVVTVLQER